MGGVGGSQQGPSSIPLVTMVPACVQRRVERAYERAKGI